MAGIAPDQQAARQPHGRMSTVAAYHTRPTALPVVPDELEGCDSAPGNLVVPPGQYLHTWAPAGPP